MQAWGDGLLASLPNRARARFRVGRFVAVEGASAVYALPNDTHRAYCDEVRADVERAISSHFGAPLTLRLVIDEDDEAALAGGTAPPARSGTAARPPATARGRGGGHTEQASGDSVGEPDLLDPEVLAAETDLAGAGLTPEERLKQAFPGAEEL